MEETAMDYGAMGMDMPLVKVADMMQGAITDEMIARILQAVNGDGSSDNMDKQEE